MRGTNLSMDPPLTLTFRARAHTEFTRRLAYRPMNRALGNPQTTAGATRSNLLGDLLLLTVSRELDLVIAMHGNVEQVAIGIHGAMLGERPR